MHIQRIALRLTALVTVLFVCLLGAVPLSAGAATTPAVQVQPSTNIADGSVVSVTGSGFTASATIAVIECQAGTTSESGCDLSTYVLTTASSSGDFSLSYIASRYLHIGTTTIDCAVPGSCILAAANILNYSDAAGTPISFDATAPTPPPLQLGGTVSPTGTVEHKTGVATVSGTLTCNRPANVTVSGELTQIYHRFVFTSYFFMSVLCTSSSTWSAVVQPSNGLFGHGTATVNATAYGSVDGSYSQANLSGTVYLSFAKNPNNPHA